MQDLMPAGLTEDGTCLLLVTAGGERFLLPVDDQLQRLVGTARRQGPRPEQPEPQPSAAPAPPPTATPASRPHQQEPSMDSALRPRDIQTRIRGGESAESVATAAGTSVEAIMPFAGPVLAERAHQAQAALRASVRRTGGPGGARTLGDAVAQFLSSHALRDDDVAWNSWRRPDGRWALTAQVEVSGRTHQAEFVHDLAGRYVVAENDDARLLTGEAGAATEGPSGAHAPDAPRLSAVGSADHLGDDAIALVRDRHEPTVLGAPSRPEPTQVTEPEPEPEPQTEPEPEPAREAEPEPAPEPEPQPEPAASESDGLEPAGDQGQLDLDVPEPEEKADDKPRRGRRGRSSVPSWDEIMFGGGSDKG